MCQRQEGELKSSELCTLSHTLSRYDDRDFLLEVGLGSYVSSKEIITTYPCTRYFLKSHQPQTNVAAS